MSYIVIILIVLAALIALIVAQRATVKERQRQELNSRAKRILMAAEEIMETAEACSLYIDATDITDALMAYYIFQIRRRNELATQDDTQTLIEKADTFKNKPNPPAKTELANDQEINQAKRTFAKASKTLRAATERKIISGQACVSMRNAMRRRILDLEVDAYERRGDAAGERSDPAVATNYYKYAKKLLIESDLKFEGKNQRVRDITTKTQVLFGNIIEDQLTKGLTKEEDVVDEHGIPRDLDAMAGKKKF